MATILARFERPLLHGLNGGIIKDKKSVNIPNVEMGLPALTEKDAVFIDWATRNEIEFIAHSFVRNRDDVMAIQSILDMRKCPIKIIAKIENREGVNNLESILDVAHGIMVARGDLGIEIPEAEVPITQKQIIKTCVRRIKPVITATQMLHSMIDNPRATRAEVSLALARSRMSRASLRPYLRSPTRSACPGRGSRTRRSSSSPASDRASTDIAICQFA